MMIIFKRSCAVLTLFTMFAALAGAQSLTETHAAISQTHPLSNGIEVSGGGDSSGYGIARRCASRESEPERRFH
jgi:hypothetical protein